MADDVFKLQGSITLDTSAFSAGLDEAVSKASAAKDRMDVHGKVDLDTSLAEKAAESLKKSGSQYKSDVMHMAAELRKSGLSQSEAMHQAYATIDQSLYEVGKASKKAFGEASSESQSASEKVQDDWNGVGDFFKKQGQGIKDALKSAFTFSAGQLLADGLQKAGTAIKETLKESITAASDLNEVQNVVDKTFGDGATQLEQWASGAKEAFGMTKLQAKEYASTLGAMLKSMQLGDQQVYSMSTSLSGLAADMASFYNLDFDVAFDKIRSGISGETEPLKQLGINMSVANLEAFALSKGITKAYESMSQAEQVTLRYNYLMEATADAQGDFARTSDEYANSVRLLETNIDSLKTRLGETLMPIASGAVKGLNDLLGAMTFEDPTRQIQDFAGEMKESTAQITAQAFAARGLMDRLTAMGDYSSLTAEQQKEWQSVASALTQLMPELTGEIDLQAGSFRNGASAIYEHIAALEMDAKAQALASAKNSILQTAVDAEADYYKSIGEHEVLYKQFDSYQKQYNAAVAAYAQETGKSIEQVEKLAGNYWKHMGESTKGMDTSQGIGQIVSLRRLMEDTSAKTVEAEKKRAEAQRISTKATQEATAQVEALEAYMESLGITAEKTAEDGLQGAKDGLDGMSGAMAEAGYTLVEFQGTLEALSKEGSEVTQLFDELESYRLDNMKSIQSQIEGVYGTFDKADRVRKTSSKKLLGNMDSQIDQLDRFQEAYSTLQEMGISDNLLSTFSYSPESIANMEALIKGGTDALSQAEGKYAAIQAKQAELAAAMSETSLAVDTQYQGMQDTASAAAETLRQHTQNILSNAELMQVGVSSATEGAVAGISEVQAAGELLAGMTWEPELSAEDNATGVVNKVKGALEKLDGQSATVTINAIMNGSIPAGFRPHATGLDYVPYDGYAALLHKGETVLTRTEADKRRRGEGERAVAENPVNVNLTVNAGSNPYEIAGEVRNALELMRWQA